MSQKKKIKKSDCRGDRKRKVEEEDYDESDESELEVSKKKQLKLVRDSEKPTNNEQKEEITTVSSSTTESEVYLEPKQWYDLKLVYDGVTFHVHKLILAKESNHFKAMLEGELTSQEPIQLSVMKTLHGSKITAKEFGEFLECLYDSNALEASDLCFGNFRAACKKKYYFYSLVYCAHYFDVMRIETQLQKMAKEAIDAGGWIPTFRALLIANTFHWAATEKDIIRGIVSIFKDVRVHAEYTECWQSLPGELREKVLEAAWQYQRDKSRGCSYCGDEDEEE